MRLSLAALGLLCALALPLGAAEPDLAGFGEIAVLHNGRIKPLDTIARNSLLRIRGKQTLKTDGRRMSAVEWLLEVMAGTGGADSFKIFQVNDPDVLGLLGRKQTRDRYLSFEDIRPSLDKVFQQAERAGQSPPQLRNRFGRAVHELGRQVDLYQRLKYGLWIPSAEDPEAEVLKLREALKSGDEEERARFARRYAFLAGAAHFRGMPPGPGEDEGAWLNIGEALMLALRGGGLRPEASLYARMVSAYRRGDVPAFNSAAADCRAATARMRPKAARKARHESWFNRLQPFYWGMVLYLVVFLMGCVSWLSGKSLQRAAYGLLVAALIVQTLGVFSRMILQGRPPVTNLYSSAVFVGWTGVLLSVVLERLHRRGIASVVGAGIGFCTLLIAHNLAMSGDTMEMMQAVLDSNFWLAVHVVTIIIGYGATYLAGTFAHVYILRRWLMGMDRETGRSLEQMTYGIVCFALLFTFVGTVLGGIWADQSWGRFWGWDPKENGALLMVLWQAIILHARAGRLIRERGLMVAAVFGNVITSLSWFGVNMLGVGLHAYGFMDKAFFWLAAFVLSQIGVMLLAALPAGSTRKRRRAVRA